uniref:Uncharacterized protein n=1 Tax=Opuntia streptacantha TaxID=393608 RepID=A0A7C9ECU1_OPUST
MIVRESSIIDHLIQIPSSYINITKLAMQRNHHIVHVSIRSKITPNLHCFPQQCSTSSIKFSHAFLQGKPEKLNPGGTPPFLHSIQELQRLVKSIGSFDQCTQKRVISRNIPRIPAHLK